MKPQFLVHDRHDNVGVIVADIKAGDTLTGACLEDGKQLSVTAKDAIPLGHKVALKDFRKGEDVIKYGIPVGAATQPIGLGHHVHVHNIKSKRW